MIAIQPIDALSFDRTGWETCLRNPYEEGLLDDEGDALMVIFQTQPAYCPPPEAPLTELQAFFREQSRMVGGGLVSTEALQIDGVHCVKHIFKTKLASGGFAYHGFCLILRKTMNYLMGIGIEETGIVGIRECSVMAELWPALEDEPVPEDADRSPFYPNKVPVSRKKGWFCDPYDERFNEGALHTIADREEYDAYFPEHPLTRVRQKLNRLVDSISLSPEILQEPAFEGFLHSAPGETPDWWRVVLPCHEEKVVPFHRHDEVKKEGWKRTSDSRWVPNRVFPINRLFCRYRRSAPRLFDCKDRYLGGVVKSVRYDLAELANDNTPNFLGIQLVGNFGDVWIVYRLARAEEWLLLDGMCNRVDLCDLLPGHVLTNVRCRYGQYDLEFTGDVKVHQLSLRADGMGCTPHLKTGIPRRFMDHERLEDAIIVTRKPRQLVYGEYD